MTGDNTKGKRGTWEGECKPVLDIGGNGIRCSQPRRRPWTCHMSRISQCSPLLFLSRNVIYMVLLISCPSQILWFGGENTETRFYTAMATTACKKTKQSKTTFVLEPVKEKPALRCCLAERKSPRTHSKMPGQWECARCLHRHLPSAYYVPDTPCKRGHGSRLGTGDESLPLWR